MNKNNLKDPREDAFNYHLRGNSFFLNGMNFYKEFFFENLNASRVYIYFSSFYCRRNATPQRDEPFRLPVAVHVEITVVASSPFARLIFL